MTENCKQQTAGGGGWGLPVVIDGIVGVAAIGFTVLLSPLIRSRYRRWHATPDEVGCSLPGDELVPNPRSEMTCAVTVRAPVSAVWPWLLQLGCRRAGWYSYDLLDNGGQPSARQILPEHRHLAVGDVVLATPDGRVAYPVAALQPDRLLVLGGTLDTRTGKPADPGDPNLTAYFGGANIFHLEERVAGQTRLLFRLRLDWNPSLLNTLAYRVFLEPISFVMGRRMLLGIRERAESGRR